jgi:hypothetical protein
VALPRSPGCSPGAMVPCHPMLLLRPLPAAPFLDPIGALLSVFLGLVIWVSGLQGAPASF